MNVIQAVRILDQTDVWHECLDIEGGDIDGILGEYGIFLSDGSQDILKEYLLGKAVQAEFREAVRWAHAEDSLLLFIPDKPVYPART